MTNYPQCEIIYANKTLNTEAFKRAILNIEISASNFTEEDFEDTERAATTTSYPDSDANIVASKCAVIREFKETGLHGSEPCWYYALGVVRHCVDGIDKCHEFSAHDEDYKEAETTTKINQHIKNDVGPTLCETFKQFGMCDKCKHKVVTPLQLGYSQNQNDETVIAQLAKLSLLEYEQNRCNEADKLGVRVSFLDAAVEKQRKQNETDGYKFEIETDIKAWDDEIDGNTLALTIENIFTEHLILPKHCSTVLTLWTIGSYCYDAFSIFPRLLLSSPEKRCGKSTLIDTLHWLVNKGLPISNTSSASLFRSIEAWQPTMLLDEADTYIANNEELRGVINSGHKKSTAFITRVEETAKNRKPKLFKTWSPMAIAMIKKPPDTIIDRSITINLKRKLSHEKTKKLDIDGYENSKHLRMKLKRFAVDNEVRLKSVNPDIPDCGNDRAVDNWLPLFALAEILGGEWPSKVKLAYQQLSLIENEETLSTMLLADIKTILEQQKDSAIHSHKLVEELKKLDERPWLELNNGKGISPNWLAKKLKPFDIKSRQLSIDGVNKNGYRLQDFTNVFERYLPNSPKQNSKTLQPNDTKVFEEKQNSSVT